MSILGFENLRLFKRADINLAAPVGPAQPNGGKPEEPGMKLRRFLASPWTFLIAAAAVIAVFHSYAPSTRLPFIVRGEIAPVDIVAPFDLVVEDTEATAKRRIDAENGVIPVYSFDPNVLANTEDKVHQLFSMGRDWLKSNPGAALYEPLRRTLIDSPGIELEPDDLAALARLRFSSDIEDIVLAALSHVLTQGVVLSRNLFSHGEKERGLLLVDLNGGERTIAADKIMDVKESEEALGTVIARTGLSERSQEVLFDVASLLLTPNANYNKIETENRKKHARESIGTVTFTVKKGRVIVRKGDEAVDETVRIVGLYNQRLMGKSDFLPDFAGSLIIYALLLTCFFAYLNSAYKKKAAENYLRMAGVVMVASIILYKLFLSMDGLIKVEPGSLIGDADMLHYGLPLQVGTLIFAAIAPDSIAVIFVLLNSLAVGMILGQDLNIMVFCLLGGLAACIGVSRFRRTYRGAVLRAGMTFVPAAYILCLIGYHLIQGTGPAGVLTVEFVLSFIGGALSGIIAFILMPTAESSFGLITASKLVELTNTDLPIFKQMSLEAPGTYHHSLVVASLAEKAAEILGLDNRLVRAGALYHDIGKTKMPEYFIENQERSADLHRDLKPSMSTLVIINHVKEGADMARKLRLPKPLRDIIEQHHGTSLVRYFYNKAKQASDMEHEKIGEETYRYPGPEPRTKEAALVMLADSVEAASRSLKTPNKEALKKVITDIFNAVLQDGQLDDCDFSLRDLRKVAVSFLTTLFAIYHPRLSYPGFSFESQPAQQAQRPKPQSRESQKENKP